MAGHPVATALADVIVETVYNAVKHASPEWIDINLEVANTGYIRLTVSHPGHLDGPRSDGLGSRVLDYLTLRHTLAENEGIVTFEGFFSAPTS